MIYFEKLDSLHQRYNGPIPEKDRLRALFNSKIGFSNRYDCARSGSMVQHYSIVSSHLINIIKTLGQTAVAPMQRKYHKQELAHLLEQRRLWKNYRRALGSCPNS